MKIYKVPSYERAISFVPVDASSCSWRGKRRVRRIRACDAYGCRDSYRKMKNCCHTKVSLAFSYPERILHRATTNRFHVFTYKGPHYLMFTNKRKRMIAVKNVTTRIKLISLKWSRWKKRKGELATAKASIASTVRVLGTKKTCLTKKRKLEEIDIVR